MQNIYNLIEFCASENIKLAMNKSYLAPCKPKTALNSNKNKLILSSFILNNRFHVWMALGHVFYCLLSRRFVFTSFTDNIRLIRWKILLLNPSVSSQGVYSLTNDLNISSSVKLPLTSLFWTSCYTIHQIRFTKSVSPLWTKPWVSWGLVVMFRLTTKLCIPWLFQKGWMVG